MRPPVFRIGLLAAWCLCAVAAPDAAAQTADDLFDPHTLKELRLFVNRGDLAELRERYQENVYVPADLEWRGVHVSNVGIRSRGLSSRNAAKPGLRIDFNHYVAGQRFLGLASVALDNLVSDPSMIRERVAMAFFTRMGAPAPRESFARLFINGTYQGLYAIVESIDNDFLQRTYHEHAGFLFERRFQGEYRGEDLGGDPGAYRFVFDPKTHERDADAVLFSPLRDLFHQANYPVDVIWRERVERYLDLKQLVTHLAIEMFLAERDGLLGYAGMANFYLYRRDGSEQHTIIAWDKDRAFDAVDSSIFLRASENVVVNGALTFKDLRTIYLDTLEACARLATSGTWLADEINRAAALVGDAAREDTIKPYSNDATDEAVAFLLRFARERSAVVLAEVERDRNAQ